MSKLLLKSVDTQEGLEVELNPGEQSLKKRYTVRCGPLHAEATIQTIGRSEGWLSLNGEVFAFRWIRSNDKIQVWLSGRVHTFELVQRTAQRSGTGHGPPTSSQLTAPMPGTILKLQVKKGAAFAAHQPLIIMESMKMEMALSIPHGGRIGEVLCKPGQLVEMGAVLLKLESDSDEPLPA